MIKSYSELILLDTFDKRFEYLKLDGVVGSNTFGSNRYLNQMLYSSAEWKNTRRNVILRDNGCDLGVEGLDILGRVTVHHINPITLEDIINRSNRIFDLDNLITTSYSTHKLIHFGIDDITLNEPIIREKNDTCPWKK